jgi:hypothetical protein
MSGPGRSSTRRPRFSSVNSLGGKVTRVQDAFAAVGITPGGIEITDAYFIARCPACSRESNLGAVELRENGEQTEYVCPECASTLVTVGPAPGLAGYRLGNQVVNSVGGMWIELPPVQ